MQRIYQIEIEGVAKDEEGESYPDTHDLYVIAPTINEAIAKAEDHERKQSNGDGDVEPGTVIDVRFIGEAID